MADLTDEERVRDLEERQKVLRGHLMCSPIVPRGRAPVQPEAGPLDTTEVDGLLPDREHIRALNRTVDALSYHVRHLLGDGRPAPLPAPLVSDKRKPLPTIYRPPRRTELPAIPPGVALAIAIGMASTACMGFLPFFVLRWLIG